MNNVLKYIKEEQLVKRFIIFLIGVFILALNYNMFIVPNNFVLGGTSGLAVILNQIFQIKPVITIYVFSFLLLIIGYLTLPFKETRRAIIGTIIYPLFISLTSPLVNVLMPYFKFDNILIVVLIAAMLQGLGTGLIYKVGFNTGGGDILVKIISRYDFRNGIRSIFKLLLNKFMSFSVKDMKYSFKKFRLLL